MEKTNISTKDTRNDIKLKTLTRLC